MKSALKRDKPGVPSQRLRRHRRQPIVAIRPLGDRCYRPCFGGSDEFPVDKLYGNAR